MPPSIAEILTFKVDEMVPLPLHYKLRLKRIFKDRFIYSSDYSDEQLILKSEMYLQAILIDFKKYFDENFSIISDVNADDFQRDINNVVSYLSIERRDFLFFILEYHDLDVTIQSIIDRHLFLVDFTIQRINREHHDCLECKETLSKEGIEYDNYKRWLSALTRTGCDYIFEETPNMIV